MNWDLPDRKTIKDGGGIDWHPPVIKFWMISDDGRSEFPVWGQGVAPAPPWRGQRADWVRQVADGECVGQGIFRVVVVTKRHRCGIVRRPGRLLSGGGRYVEVGEAYSCPAVRAADVAAWKDHLRRLKIKAIPVDPDEGDWMFEFLSGLQNSEMMCT